MQTEKRASSQGATWGLAILFGVVGASIQRSVGGFFIGAVLGGLFAQILHLRSRTEALDQQLRDLKQRLAGVKDAPEERESTPWVTPAAAPAPMPAMLATASPTPVAPQPAVRAAAPPPQPTAPARP
ncbi:MAG: hypothetical protein ACREXP_05745, partial [Steroidobacteraceae bacterium]